jgi:DNA-binding MarR family transcriptional regulator
LDVRLRITAAKIELRGPMTNTNDLREVAACTYFRARRMARLVTRFYDNQLGSVGINTNQLGLLAKLLDASMLGVSGLSVGVLAERVGMHPSTLTRDLKPLMKQGLVQDGNDPEDRRIRKILITKKGEGKLRDAIPAWRSAQKRVQDVLGNELMLSLNALLDLASTRLPR